MTPGCACTTSRPALNITERSAFGIITNLVEAGYLVKEKNGRRNRYHIQAHLPLPEPDGRERAIGEIPALNDWHRRVHDLKGVSAPAFEADGEGGGMDRSGGAVVVFDVLAPDRERRAYRRDSHGPWRRAARPAGRVGVVAAAAPRS